ncbi:MAG: zinc ribbon domain-containing protein [Chloroflexi bacterium HGW-Chloroflexi-1]|nr:MAG: zinc ribbon domain-containing protein [Chloroflexi bacterium HGW-Chloroflexi-1]
MQFPPELLNSIGVVLEVVVALVTALLVAFWISLVVWTLRDIRSRTRDIFAWLLAMLLVLATGPIGWLLYSLLRPRETMAEVYDRQLEEEALLRDITTRRACSNCQAVTEPEWLLCPHCRTELRRSCAGCGRPLDLDWVACPYCTTPVGASTNHQGERGFPIPETAPIGQPALFEQSPGDTMPAAELAYEEPT